MIPKRQAKSPKDLRPIALTDALGKAVLGLISKKAMAACFDRLRKLPQFAYLPGRSTLDALNAAFDFCRQVRELQGMHPNIWDKYQGKAAPALIGGLALSLDLSQAFDTISRKDISKGLNYLDLDPSLIRLLMNWLVHTECHLNHGNLTATITAHRGMRQGCKASPFLWNAWTAHFFHRLPELYGFDWVRKVLIIYADDILGTWLISSPQDFYNACNQMFCILHLLESLGMTVNLAKSAVLCSLRGTQAVKFRKRFLCRTKDGVFLRLTDGIAQPRLIPVKSSHPYLGAIISFLNFEDQTMEYRLKVGHDSFMALKPWFVGRCSLPLGTRLQVWRTCILSSYVYGLSACGVTLKGLQRFQSRVGLDYRIILRSPAHVYRVSTVELLSTHGLPMPVVDLRDRLLSSLQKRIDTLATFPSHDIVCHFAHCSHLERVTAVFDLFLKKGWPTYACAARGMDL